MNKNNQNECKFHFVMDAEMKKSLEATSLFKKLGSFSQLVNKVLTLLGPVIEQKHLKNKQMASQYRLVHDDLKVKRKGVFVYLPSRQYRQLKSIHQDLNVYSIAQILRLFLGVFLEFVRVYGDGAELRLMKIYLEWKAKQEKKRYTWWPIEELLHFCFQKSKISRLLTLYDWKFQPIGFFRL